MHSWLYYFHLSAILIVRKANLGITQITATRLGLLIKSRKMRACTTRLIFQDRYWSKQDIRDMRDTWKTRIRFTVQMAHRSECPGSVLFPFIKWVGPIFPVYLESSIRDASGQHSGLNPSRTKLYVLCPNSYELLTRRATQNWGNPVNRTNSVRWTN